MPCMSARAAFRIESVVRLYVHMRLVVPDQSPSLPAVVHENELEPSLVFPYMCWGGCYGIGQAGYFTQRLSDGLLHSLYGCCGRYELSKPEAEVLEELFRRRQLQITVFVLISCRQKYTCSETN